MARFVEELYVERLGEILPQFVARPHLEGLAVAHHRFGGPGRRRAGETFLVGFAPDKNRDSQHVDHEVRVDLMKDPQGVIVRVRFGGVRGVALLPEELRRPQEKPWPQFPAHDVGPLVDPHRKIPVALDPLGQERVDDRLAGRAYHDRLFQFLAAAVRNDGQLGAEALDVLGLAVEIALGDEQGEVRVRGPRGLDPGVDFGLHALPDGIAVRPDDDGATHRAALGELRFGQHVLVPLREVGCLGGQYVGLGHGTSMLEEHGSGL